MERARGRDESATGQRDDAVDTWPGRYCGPDPGYGPYTEYADPLAEAEFMTESREIMGLDTGPGC
jgi:hypothetical protein